MIRVNMETLKAELSELKNEIIEIKNMLLSNGRELGYDQIKDIELEESVCADFFKALSNEERIKILKSLSKDDQYFAQLKEITGLDHSPLRFHLTVLMEVNLVGQERFRGKYSITELGKQTLIIASTFFRLMKDEVYLDEKT
ncbi:MAG TPA: winged helix-turn-helix domain-containing protein [Candidatus Methanofastidiosa archaeon]|nr:winged helix-turn-helix domain-containing protein [Candidatus Methanofastidiosa archaeon]